MAYVRIARLEDCELPPPAKGSEEAAGFDLQSNEFFNVNLKSGKRYCFPTGFVWEIPKNHVGIIKPRSGLAFKHGIDVLAGVIDSDYRGEVKVILQNHGEDDLVFQYKERIAQMVILPLAYAGQMLQEVALEVLTETERNEGGFGSTGTK